MQRRLHGGGVWRVPATDRAFKNARRLRREMSLPEKLLWVRLRSSTVRIRRQHPIDPYASISTARRGSWRSKWMGSRMTLEIAGTFSVDLVDSSFGVFQQLSGF